MNFLPTKSSLQTNYRPTFNGLKDLCNILESKVVQEHKTNNSPNFRIIENILLRPRNNVDHQPNVPNGFVPTIQSKEKMAHLKRKRNHRPSPTLSEDEESEPAVKNKKINEQYGFLEKKKQKAIVNCKKQQFKAFSFLGNDFIGDPHCFCEKCKNDPLEIPRHVAMRYIKDPRVKKTKLSQKVPHYIKESDLEEAFENGANLQVLSENRKSHAKNYVITKNLFSEEDFVEVTTSGSSSPLQKRHYLKSKEFFAKKRMQNSHARNDSKQSAQDVNKLLKERNGPSTSNADLLVHGDKENEINYATEAENAPDIQYGERDVVDDEQNAQEAAQNVKKTTKNLQRAGKRVHRKRTQNRKIPTSNSSKIKNGGRKILLLGQNKNSTVSEAAHNGGSDMYTATRAPRQCKRTSYEDLLELDLEQIINNSKQLEKEAKQKLEESGSTPGGSSKAAQLERRKERGSNCKSNDNGIKENLRDVEFVIDSNQLNKITDAVKKPKISNKTKAKRGRRPLKDTNKKDELMMEQHNSERIDKDALTNNEGRNTSPIKRASRTCKRASYEDIININLKQIFNNSKQYEKEAKQKLEKSDSSPKSSFTSAQLGRGGRQRDSGIGNSDNNLQENLPGTESATIEESTKKCNNTNKKPAQKGGKHLKKNSKQDEPVMQKQAEEKTQESGANSKSPHEPVKKEKRKKIDSKSERNVHNLEYDAEFDASASPINEANIPENKTAKTGRKQMKEEPFKRKLNSEQFDKAESKSKPLNPTGKIGRKKVNNNNNLGDNHNPKGLPPTAVNQEDIAYNGAQEDDKSKKGAKNLKKNNEKSPLINEKNIPKITKRPGRSCKTSSYEDFFKINLQKIIQNSKKIDDKYKIKKKTIKPKKSNSSYLTPSHSSISNSGQVSNNTDSSFNIGSSDETSLTASSSISHISDSSKKKIINSRHLKNRHRVAYPIKSDKKRKKVSPKISKSIGKKKGNQKTTRDKREEAEMKSNKMWLEFLDKEEKSSSSNSSLNGEENGENLEYLEELRQVKNLVSQKKKKNAQTKNQKVAGKKHNFNGRQKGLDSSGDGKEADLTTEEPLAKNTVNGRTLRSKRAESYEVFNMSHQKIISELEKAFPLEKKLPKRKKDATPPKNNPEQSALNSSANMCSFNDTRNSQRRRTLYSMDNWMNSCNFPEY